MTTFKSCRYCTAPKRHPGCHDHCPEYQEEKATYDKCKEQHDKERNVSQGIYEQVTRGVRKAGKRKRGGYSHVERF